MTTKGATIKVVSKQIKELSDLTAKYNVLGKKHVEQLNKNVDLQILCNTLKKQNKDLRVILVRFEKDNKSLQQSLDDCQQELERVRESKISTSKTPSYWVEDMFRDDLVEG